MNVMAYFEQIGRFFFEKNRAWIFFVFLTTPFFLTLAILAPRYASLRETEKSFDTAALRGRSALEKRQVREQFLIRYSNFEPYFIDQCLESLPLLQENLSHLHAMKNHPACPNRQAVMQRINFLESGDNRLSFAEENIRSSKRVKETEERLLHPVEIDSNDLDRLLCLIEDVAIGEHVPHPNSPQLIIHDFVLTKKNHAVYELNLSLLKREFIHASEK
jgi:hypothetical protein